MAWPSTETHLKDGWVNVCACHLEPITHSSQSIPSTSVSSFVPLVFATARGLKMQTVSEAAVTRQIMWTENIYRPDWSNCGNSLHLCPSSFRHKSKKKKRKSFQEIAQTHFQGLFFFLVWFILLVSVAAFSAYSYVTDRRKIYELCNSNRRLFQRGISFSILHIQCKCSGRHSTIRHLKCEPRLHLAVDLLYSMS